MNDFNQSSRLSVSDNKSENSDSFQQANKTSCQQSSAKLDSSQQTNKNSYHQNSTMHGSFQQANNHHSKTNCPKKEETEICDNHADKFATNAIAVAIAELLCEDKTKIEITELCQFLNVLSSAIRTYLV